MGLPLSSLPGKAEVIGLAAAEFPGRRSLGNNEGVLKKGQEAGSAKVANGVQNARCNVQAGYFEKISGCLGSALCVRSAIRFTI